jgi:hypothetical protein
MFCRLVSRVLISWWDYVFIRPEGLSIKASSLIFVYVIMQIINIIYEHRCMQTGHEERVMGD